MSRSGYSDDTRGQPVWRDLLAALDAMPVKRLAGGVWITSCGDVCAVGLLARAHGLLVLTGSYEMAVNIMVKTFGIPERVLVEVMRTNDFCGPLNETPEQRWERMRRYVEARIVAEGTR